MGEAMALAGLPLTGATYPRRRKAAAGAAQIRQARMVRVRRVAASDMLLPSAAPRRRLTDLGRYTDALAMPKMKTHSGAKKRFKRTANGKIRARHAFTSHILEKK